MLEKPQETLKRELRIMWTLQKRQNQLGTLYRTPTTSSPSNVPLRTFYPFIRRRLVEAFYIASIKPELNKKVKLYELKLFPKEAGSIAF